MSQREVKYFKLLAKMYEIKERFFSIREDLDEDEGDKAELQKKQANLNKQIQEQMIKINKLKEEGKTDKVLKEEMNLKKKEANIAKYKQNIQKVQRRIEKRKADLQKYEVELRKIESEINLDFPEKMQ